MSVFTNFLSNDVLKFVGHQLLLCMVKSSGRYPVAKEVTPRNTQCVKLTKEHGSVLQMVTFWCSIRLNKLQQAGADAEMIAEIARHDTRFLNTLSHSLATQKDQKPAYDAWLFFNSDVKSTDFFELQQCARGSKTAQATYIVQADC